MKKSTIWILGVIMGLSFLSLLYLQVSYIEEMVKMRNEQFDESVKRSLYQVSKNVEYDETQRWLEKDVTATEREALSQSSSSPQKGDIIQQTQRYNVSSQDGTMYSAFELKTITTKPSALPKAMISRRHGTNTIPQTSRTLQEAIKNRYLYQRFLLDEVVWQMLYRASDKSLEERVNFKNLDQY